MNHSLQPDQENIPHSSDTWARLDWLSQRVVSVEDFYQWYQQRYPIDLLVSYPTPVKTYFLQSITPAHVEEYLAQEPDSRQ